MTLEDEAETAGGFMFGSVHKFVKEKNEDNNAKTKITTFIIGRN